MKVFENSELSIDEKCGINVADLHNDVDDSNVYLMMNRLQYIFYPAIKITFFGIRL
ncbi:hypothetical protein A3Q56_01048 [Intoshia linei]|uniref:Uncharacterized protein n=1 Tax=Intoshia linei TaxID=1819745 RepID=A0A177BA60_9BILA|nr:hypothetical protein A3Q56_01048 [Intoshia linei]